MQKKVSIIVLNYNGLEFLKVCLHSIWKQTYPNIEIIVADNCSTDGSIAYLKNQRGIIGAFLKRNYGYTKANNLAARKASGDFLFFLNNDTELFPDMIEKLMAAYQEGSILSPAQIQTISGKKLIRAGIGMDIFGYPYVNDNPRKTRVFYADGAAIFVKKKDFQRIGGFDDDLFIFQEDIDFSWRAQIFGYRVISCWEAKLHHYGGGAVLGGGPKLKKYESSYLRRYLNEKNVVRNILKNYSFPLFIFILFLLALIHFAEVVVLSVTLNFKVVGCYLRAYWWNILYLKDTWQMRKFVQKERKVSDFVLTKKMYWSYSKLYSFIKLGMPQFKN